MERDGYWFWLCNQDGIYRSHIEKLLEIYDIEDLFTYDKDAIVERVKLRFPDVDKSFLKSLNALLRKRDEKKVMDSLEKFDRGRTRFISCESSIYPQKLLELSDYPFCLYVRGKLPLEDRISVGMIGARVCSDYGKAMTKDFSGTLAHYGIQIISGMAKGIDSISSRAAIENGGKTFVVLGCGVDVIYPMENFDLYDSIIRNGGGVISEYPMGTQPFAWQFPHRNRIISALSDYLLVMEARKQSGTLTTVSRALEQGKDIFALPGRITDSLSESCNLLISEGAGMLTTPNAFLEYIKKDYGVEFFSFSLEDEVHWFYGDDDTSKVFRALDYSPKTAERIADETDVNILNVIEILTDFELQGIITESGIGNFVKNS